MAGGLNDTAGGWLTGGIAQSHLLSAAAHNSDPTLMTATASALYQQQPAAIQQVDILQYLYHFGGRGYCFRVAH